MSILSLFYLIKLSILLFYSTFPTITFSVSLQKSQKALKRKAHRPFEIDLTKPAPIEEESIPTPFVSSAAGAKIRVSGWKNFFFSIEI